MHWTTKQPQPTKDPGNNSDSYVVNNIIRQINTEDRIRYIIRWYGYIRADQMAKQSNNISEDFIQLLFAPELSSSQKAKMSMQHTKKLKNEEKENRQ